MASSLARNRTGAHYVAVPEGLDKAEMTNVSKALTSTLTKLNHYKDFHTWSSHFLSVQSIVSPNSVNIAEGKDGQDEFHDDIHREVGVPRRRGLVDDSPGLMVGVAEHDLELSVEVEGVLERGPAGGFSVDVDVGSRRQRFDVQDALSAA